MAQLEQKIDGLVSLLAAGHHLQASASSPSTPESQESTQANSQVLQETSNSRTEEARSPAPIYPVAGDGLIVYEMIPEFQLTTAQAQTYLDVFRVEYTPRFPFVVISPQTTPSELYSREICLFWAIMNTVAPLPGELQLAVKKSFREYVSDHVIVRKDKRLGNLQAILIYIAW